MKKRFNLNHLIAICFTIIITLGLIYVPNSFASLLSEKETELIYSIFRADDFDEVEDNIKDNIKNKNLTVYRTNFCNY